MEISSLLSLAWEPKRRKNTFNFHPALEGVHFLPKDLVVKVLLLLTTKSLALGQR